MRKKKKHTQYLINKKSQLNHELYQEIIYKSQLKVELFEHFKEILRTFTSNKGFYID